MATLDEAAIQLANSLPVDAVPAKLRCGSCNKLAVDALKLPCCAQSICEPCSRALPETCPICSHSPVSAEDCTPIKSLRMSVKAFIKNEQKKRNKDTEVAPPPADTAHEAATVTEPPAANGDTHHTDVQTLGDGINRELALDDVAAADNTEAVEEPKVLRNGDNADDEVPAHPEGEQEDEEDDDDHVVITTERPEQETQEHEQYARDESYAQNHEQQDMERSYGNGNESGDFGYNQNQQNFSGMDFSNMNNFNPMMMQNGMGMPNFAMGMQNMMGMPGMNMDPSMMFNGGFGGMGGMNDMSMMNMGMGMGSMGGFGGMPGMGMGGGPGFFPGNGGYNQPNFGNNMHQNFHHNRGYGGRPYGRGFGRGRGWGGYNRGRGNWQNQGHFQGPNPNYMNQQYQQQQRNFQGDEDNATMGQQQGVRRGSPSYEPMDGSATAADDNPQKSFQAPAGEGGDTNQTDIEKTDQIGDAPSEVKMADAEGKDSTQPLGEEGIEGKHGFIEHHPAQANTQIQAESEQSTEASVQDVVNDVSMDVTNDEPRATTLNAEGGPETGSTEEALEANAAVQGAAQGQFYDQQHQQGSVYGVRGRGGFRGGRGGFRGRGGAYGYVAFPGEPEHAVAPPINAPTGPKALREGKPNHGRYSRPAPSAPPAAPAVSSVIETTHEQPPTRDERGRSRSRSRSVSDRSNVKERPRSRDEYYESDGARREKRKHRDDDYDATRNGDASKEKLSRKGRSRSETPDDQSRRRNRDNDGDRHHSRSHRDRSRDRHRRRHRSRSPERDASEEDSDVDGSRRKSKSDRRRDGGYDESRYSKDKEKSRKSSRRDDDYDRDYKERSNNSSKHARSGRDERDRERGKPRPVLEEPQDDIGFKIKGSKSASMQAAVSPAMKPPTIFARDRDSRRQNTQDSASGTPNTAAGDPYAEERERRQRERLDRENTLRRQSTQSLGKRTSRDEDEFDVPMGPKSDTGRGVKKPRRKVSYKYEDEVADGYEDRERRWR